MWYFEEHGQTTGPLQEPEMRAAIAAGRLTRATLVWRDGMGGWLPAEQTPLAAAFGTPGTWAGAQAMSPGFSPPGYAGGPLRFAGFWIRLGAYVIDAVLVQIGAYILGALVGLVMSQGILVSDGELQLSAVQIAGGGIGLLWILAYYIVFQASSWQATPGKRLLGLRIIRTDGQKIGPGLSLGRYLSYIVSGLILGIGFLMIGWAEQKKGLHDMMCGTRVVYGRA